METRVAVMSIIVEDPDSVEALNGLLHENGKYIIGRMGIPYHKRGISIISIALDASRPAAHRVDKIHLSCTIITTGRAGGLHRPP